VQLHLTWPIAAAASAATSTPAARQQLAQQLTHLVMQAQMGTSVRSHKASTVAVPGYAVAGEGGVDTNSARDDGRGEGGPVGSGAGSLASR
jgi:hypothetical protein